MALVRILSEQSPKQWVLTTLSRCFYINLPIGAISAVTTALSFNLPTQPLSATLKEKILQLDLVGAMLMMGGLIAFILGFQYGGQSMPWKSSTVIGLLVGSVLIFLVFALWEVWQGEYAMIALRLYKQRAVYVSSIFQFLFAGTYFITLYYLPIYFQSVDNASPSGSGVRNLPLVLSLGIASISGGLALSKLGHAVPFMAVGSCLATIACGLFYTLDEHSNTGRWIGSQILGGVAWGAAWQCSLAVAQAGQDPTDLASLTSIILRKAIIVSKSILNADYLTSFPNLRRSPRSFCRTMWL